jgi:hypothetical protein
MTERYGLLYAAVLGALAATIALFAIVTEIYK